MDQLERERRIKAKAQRKPINPATLEVQNGLIDVRDLIRYIDKNLPRKLRELRS